jgi:hypothetical protein
MEGGRVPIHSAHVQLVTHVCCSSGINDFLRNDRPTIVCEKYSIPSLPVSCNALQHAPSHETTSSMLASYIACFSDSKDCPTANRPRRANKRPSPRYSRHLIHELRSEITTNTTSSTCILHRAVMDELLADFLFSTCFICVIAPANLHQVEDKRDSRTAS